SGARPPRRGPPAGIRGRGKPLACRAEPGGEHRPVGPAAGGRTVFLERSSLGAGGVLPTDPGGGLVKAALIGAGRIARQHLTCLKGLPGVELVAVCDLSLSTAEAAAERYGVRSWFTDHRAMLGKARPDVVHVTTPPTSHFRLAMDSFDAGAHVIVEKPATVTFEELEKLVGRARDTGRHLVEDHNYVFNHAPQEILRRIGSGQFGAVTHVEVHICLDILGPNGFADPNLPHPALTLAGGAIADFLPHLASLARLFVGPHRTAQTVWAKRKPSPLPFD